MIHSFELSNFADTPFSARTNAYFNSSSTALSASEHGLQRKWGYFFYPSRSQIGPTLTGDLCVDDLCYLYANGPFGFCVSHKTSTGSDKKQAAFKQPPTAKALFFIKFWLLLALRWKCDVQDTNNFCL